MSEDKSDFLILGTFLFIAVVLIVLAVVSAQDRLSLNDYCREFLDDSDAFWRQKDVMRGSQDLCCYNKTSCEEVVMPDE